MVPEKNWSLETLAGGFLEQDMEAQADGTDEVKGKWTAGLFTINKRWRPSECTSTDE